MFQNRLKNARVESGLTQIELANLINISPTAYNKYEMTDTRPSYENLVKIAQTLNVTTDYLLGLEDEKTASEESEAAEKEKVIDEIIEVVSKMSEEDQEVLTSAVRLLAVFLNRPKKS